ncbi:substrate-binding domain-containing protein [Oerskovia sp. M15]
MVGRPLGAIDGVDTVTNDDVRGAGLAVDHLVGLGRSRIAHLSGSSRPAGTARRAATKKRCDGTGWSRRSASSGRRRPRRAGHGRLPGALRPQRRRGLRRPGPRARAGAERPGDLAVVGYDDSSLAQRARPRLTSVHQPRERMGRSRSNCCSTGWAVGTRTGTRCSSPGWSCGVDRS